MMDVAQYDSTGRLVVIGSCAVRLRRGARAYWLQFEGVSGFLWRVRGEVEDVQVASLTVPRLVLPKGVAPDHLPGWKPLVASNSARL
jgi:hypothetical protein